MPIHRLYFAVLLCVLQYSCTTAKGPICLKCDRVRQPYDCANVVTCGDHELCSVRKYLTDDGHRWFDVGCTDAQVCTVTKIPFGRRESIDVQQMNSSSHEKRTHAGEITECQLCCSNNLCNTGTLCGANTLQHSGQLLCFECQSEQAPDTCNTITMCTHDEECFIQSARVGLSGSTSWTSGCKRKDSCQQFTQSQGSNCHSCCNSEICNSQCPASSTVTDHCKANPCVHGRCHNTLSGYTCTCSHGYNGTRCNTALPKPRDCSDRPGIRRSGIYHIYPFGTSLAVNVYCVYDSTGAWTVIQKRFDGSVNFTRNWYYYKHGFGSPHGEYWLGNDIIHQLTANSKHKLRIQLTDWAGVTKYANYGVFTVADERHKYRLHVASYTGDAGDGFRVHENNSFFSTYDNNHDTCGSLPSCAQKYGGGWWYDCCHRGNLNGGTYYHGHQTHYADGLSWYPWHGYDQSMKTTTMMIKRI